MAETAQLPFERGRSMADLGLPGLTLSDTTFQQVEGRVYTVKDTVHGTGREVRLIVLKNDTGAVITVARKFLKFSTGALDFMRRCGGYNDAAGGIVVALDDAYTVGIEIPDDDLFFAVLEGPVSVTTEAGSVSLSAGESVASDASAFVNGAVAAAGEFVAGTIDQDAAATDTAVVIHMAGNVSLPPAAG